MANSGPPNVKIYDRPEPKGPKPIVIIIAVLVLLAIGLLVYKFVLHPAPAPVAGHVGFMSLYVSRSFSYVT